MSNHHLKVVGADYEASLPDIDAWDEALVFENNFSDNVSIPHPTKESIMSDPLTRDELAARLEAIEARTDTKFEKLFSEIKEARASSEKEVAVLTSDLRGDIKNLSTDISAKLAQAAGQKTVWGAVATAIGVILFGIIATVLVLVQVAQTGYDSGVNAEQRVSEAVKAVEPPAKFDPQTGKPL